MDFIFDPSLVLYLPLYQLDGASFMSKDSYGHLCTVIGAVWTPNGRYFDGTDDYINCDDHASLDLTTAFTLEAWVYHLATNVEMAIAKRVEGGDNAYQLYTDGNDKINLYIFWSGGGQTITGDTPITNDAWYHIAGTYDSEYLKVYHQGVLDCTPVAETHAVGVTTDPVRIGWGYSDAYAWYGNIGEARIYNRALTPQEIQHNYLATKWRYR